MWPVVQCVCTAIVLQRMHINIFYNYNQKEKEKFIRNPSELRNRTVAFYFEAHLISIGRKQMEPLPVDHALTLSCCSARTGFQSLR